MLDVQSWTELSFWNDNLQSLNGALMRTEGVVNDLDVRDLVSDADSILVDATEFRGAVEDVSMQLKEPLEEGDLGESSMIQELQALELALQARGESLRGQFVHWVGDSQSGVTILMVGSMKPRCHAVAVASCTQI